ncbi:hypothetical protein ROSMUCSMR3_01576 [Roseovarius mucosus]|uniref:Uncharacterized protein n=1 Tax=Roseovarius mucosus TaxID=215743 RepID=A0A1V0RMQ4_9RHOB|nr:hypothetical protein ROSMUCSMR3_01576 [Roseovarius mucosus]
MYPRFYTFACGPKTPSWLTVSAISRSEGLGPIRSGGETRWGVAERRKLRTDLL